MTIKQALGGVAVLAAGVASAAVIGNQTASSVTTTLQDGTPVVELRNCGDFNQMMPDSSCFAAGTIRFVSLYNMQGAAQFCVWSKANPGEWLRLQNYAKTNTLPSDIVTWFGGHIKNDLQAYFAAGGPAFTIQPNTAPNRCKTPLAPPAVTGVTPGQTDVTVTVGG